MSDDNLTSNTDAEDRAHLLELASDGKWHEAHELCLTELSRPGVDRHYWLTRKGYVEWGFYRNADVHYQSSATFETLVDEFPADPNAHFWLGWAHEILYGDYYHRARQEFETALALDPDYVYAEIALTGMAQTPPVRSEQLLRSVLRKQPTNAAAMLRLARVLVGGGKNEQAREVLKTLLATSEPYVETNFDIMNDYLSEVFCFWHWRRAYLGEVNNLLAKVSEGPRRSPHSELGTRNSDRGSG